MVGVLGTTLGRRMPHSRQARNQNAGAPGRVAEATTGIEPVYTALQAAA